MKRFLSTVFACVLVGACGIEPTNPWDPETPIAEQERARVLGRVMLPTRDLESKPIELVVLQGDGRLLEENGTARVFRTRTSAEGFPTGWRDDGREDPAGTFEITLAPGTWRVLFSAERNGELLYDDATTPTLTLRAGETAFHSLRPQLIPSDRFQGAVTGTVEGLSPGRSYVVRLVSVTGELEERTLVKSGEGSYTFQGVVPGTEYRVRVEGDGYAPAVSPVFSVEEQHTANSPREVPPLRLVSIGELFQVAFDEAGSEAPYVAHAEVPVRLTSAHLFLSSPEQGLHHVEVRALPAVLFDAVLADEAAGVESDRRWRELGEGSFPVDLAEGLADGARDGEHTILAQLRLCLQEPCDCPAGAPLSTCTPPLASGIASLPVVLDTEAPTLVEVSVGGVTARPSTPAAPLLVSCARFGGACPVPDDVDPYAALVELTVNDVSGRVSGIALTLDDEEAPSTFTTLTSAPGLATWGGLAPGIAPADGEHALRVWARDAAGNVGLVHERSIVVDVTPIALADPALVVTGSEPYDVDGQTLEILPGDLFTVDVRTVDETPVRWRVRRTDGPLLSGLPASGFAPYEGPTTAFPSGLHGDEVTLEVSVEDSAGNISTAPLRALRLWRTGRVLGSVALEGGSVPTQLEAVLVNSDGNRLLGDAFGDGSFVFPSAMRGVYVLELTVPGFTPYQRTGIVVEPARDTELGVVPLALPRGHLVGRFVLEGREGASTNTGIQVSLLNEGGEAIAGTTTLADGSYRFRDVPAGTGYSVVAAFEGYVPASFPGVEVHANVESAVHPDDDGAPTPVVLRELVGDFRLCAATGVLSHDCEPLLWTRHALVDVGGVDLSGITAYRIGTAPFPNESAGWQPITYTGDGRIVPPRATLGAAGDGRYTVYLQLRVDEANAGDVLTAEIIYDSTPPSDVTLVLRRGASALRDGFTNQPTVTAVVTANGGSGDVAPLGDAFVRFSDVAPTSPPATTRCAHGASCGVPLDDTQERVHRAFAFSCDAAGNCSETPVEARIVYDVTPPRALHGVTLTPSSPVLRTTGGVTYTRSSLYDIAVNVGAARTNAGAPVVDGAGADVPDVVGYRFGVTSVPPSGNGSFAFEGIELSQFTSLLAPNATLLARGPSLPGIEAAYRVYAQFVDAAGNATALEDNPYHFDLVLDETPPGVTFTLNGGDEFTNDPVVTLDTQASAIDPPMLARISTDGGLFDTFEERSYPFELGQDTWDLGATAPDGTKTVHVRFLDAAGNATERSDSIFLDRTPPQALLVGCSTCSFHEGQAYTNAPTRQVVLDLLASDNSGWVDLVDVSGLGAPAAYAPVLAVTLPGASDGLQELSVRFLDPAGNESAPTTLPVVLDRGAPAPSLVINSGATATNDPTVRLSLSATDATSPIVGMRLSNTAAFSGQVQPLSPEMLWTLGFPDTDGPKTVYLEVYDAAGNRAETATGILLDTIPPTGTVVLAGGAARTNQLTVDVTLAYDADAVTHVLSTSPLDASCANAAFPPTDTPPPATTQVTFPPSASGEPEVRSVYVCTRDRAGNVAMAMDSIVVDQDGPSGTLVIEGGAPYALGGTVTVSVTAPSDTTQMKTAVNTAPNCAVASGYVPFSSSFTATLANTSGTQTVYACLKDAAGNFTASPIFDRIIRDRQAPVVSVAIESGAAYTTSPVVTLHVTASDDLSGPEGGVTGMRVANNVPPTSGAYEAFSGARTWTVDAPGLGGNKTVCVEVQDAAGRTASACDSIILDLDDPSGSVTLAGGASYSTSATVSARFVGDGGAGYTFLYREGALDCSASAGWLPFDGDETVSMTLSGEGFREVYACFREPSGRTTLASDGIVVDTQAPTAPKPASPEAGAWVASARPTLRWSAASGADLYRLTVRNSANTIVLGPLDVFTTEHTPTTDLPQGTLSWSVVARDAAGNESALDSAFPRALHIDTAAPTGLTDLAVAGGALTNDPTPTLSWRTATDTLTPANALSYTLEIADGTSFSALVLSAALENTSSAATMSYTLESPLGEGSYAWRVRVRDRAGNELVAVGPTFSIDLTPPAPPTFESVASPTTSPVALRWTSVAGATAYLLEISQNAGQSGCGTFSPLTTIVSTTTYNVNAPNTAGCHYTARVASLDGLGNQSAFSSVGFYVDTVAPTPGTPAIVINNGAAATASEVVTLSLTASGATQVRIHAQENANCTTPPSPPTAAQMAALTAQPYSPVLTYVLPPNNPATNSGPAPNDRCKWLTVSFGDEAGNFSPPTTQRMAGILLDTLPPDAPQIATESTVVNDSQITVVLAQNAADHHFATYQIRNSALQSAWSNIAPDNPTCTSGSALCRFTVTLRQDSENRISIRAIDTAGSPSAEDFVVIREDSTPPPSPSVLELRPSDRRVDVSWAASPAEDLGGYRLYYTLNTGGACPSSPSAYVGTFAEQGRSPIDVGTNTSFTLTGVLNGIELCVGVLAYDQTVRPGPNTSSLVSASVTAWEVSPVLRAQLSAQQLGIPAGSRVGALAHKDGVLYVAANGTGLTAFDVSNEDCFDLPTGDAFADCTSRLRSTTTMSEPVDIAFSGGTAFVADKTEGIHVLNVFIPGDPVYLRSIQLPNVTAVAASGDVLAVGRTDGVSLYSIPSLLALPASTQPTPTNVITTPSVHDLDIQHDLLAVGASTGTALYRLSAGATPLPIQCATGTNKEGVKLSGKTLYTGHTNDEVQVCDLSTVDGGSYAAIGSVGTDRRFRIEVAGPYLYVAGDGGVTIVDVSERHSPRLMGKYEVLGGQARAGSIAVSGRRVFLATGVSPTIHVLHVGDPNALELVRTDSAVSGGQSSALIGDNLVTFGSLPSVVHLGRDALSIDAQAPFIGYDSAAEGERVLNFGPGRFTVRALDESGGLTLLNDTLFSPGQIVAGALLWPFVVLLTYNNNEVSLRTFNARTGAAVSTMTLATSFAGLITLHYAHLALYQGFVLVKLNSNAAHNAEGLWRVRLNPRTGALTSPAQVEQDTNVIGVKAYGHRVWWWGPTLQVKSTTTLTDWTSEQTATLSGQIFGTRVPSFDGGFVYLPQSSAGTFLVHVDYDGAAPYAPASMSTVAIFPSSFATTVVPTGDRVFVDNYLRPMEILRLR